MQFYCTNPANLVVKQVVDFPTGGAGKAAQGSHIRIARLKQEYLNPDAILDTFLSKLLASIFARCEQVLYDKERKRDKE